MKYRLFQVLSTFLQSVLSSVVRAVVTTLVFGACVVGMAHYLGVPLPSAHQLLGKLEGLSKLARVLS